MHSSSTVFHCILTTQSKSLPLYKVAVFMLFRVLSLAEHTVQVGFSHILTLQAMKTANLDPLQHLNLHMTSNHTDDMYLGGKRFSLAPRIIISLP